MKFLYFLEKLRNPVADFLFERITKIGEETVFLAVALIFFWCVSKRRGYLMLLVGLVGTIINQALKLIFRIPRPWIIDEGFTVVGGDPVKEAASGFSFPSGHTQNVAGTFGSIAVSSKKRRTRIICIAVIALVAFSRMYLGVHTALDVFVSLGVAAFLVFFAYPIFSSNEKTDKAMPYICIVSFLLSLGMVLYTFLLPESSFESEAALENLYSGRKNASTLIGCMIALPIVYYVDKYYTHFETRSTWYGQVVKLVVGFGVVLGMKAGLSSPLIALLGNEFVARAVRYFLVVIFAGVVWPMFFSYISKIKIPVLDRFGTWAKSVFAKKNANAETKDNQ